jgi:hypothetical protein
MPWRCPDGETADLGIIQYCMRERAGSGEKKREWESSGRQRIKREKP